MKETDMFAGIYVKNVPKTARILKKALGAKQRQLQPNMVELTVGKGRLLINQRAMKGHAKTAVAKTPSKELELGVWVDDLEAVYQKITHITQNDKGAEISYVSDIENKQSGIKDFRFRLPEGYYVRVTADASQS